MRTAKQLAKQRETRYKENLIKIKEEQWSGRLKNLHAEIKSKNFVETSGLYKHGSPCD